MVQHTRTEQAGRSAASWRSVFDLPALPGGREEVLRSGSTGMDTGRAATGPWMARGGVPTELNLREGT